MSNEVGGNGTPAAPTNTSAPAGLSGVDNLKKHKMSLLALLALMYSWTCGGPFGIENIVSSCGPGLAIVVLLVFPFFWSVPQGLISAELGSAIPDEGGYYIWIRRAFGEFWGYQAGWWRSISCYVDSAIYIVLAVSYLGAFITLSDFQAYLCKAALIIFFTIINLRGLGDVGKLTTILSVFVVLVTVTFVIIGFANWTYNPVEPFAAGGWSGLGLALVIAVWLYSGYESMGMVAGELQNPQDSIKAILISLPVVVATYVFPILAGMAANGEWESWGIDPGELNFVEIAGGFGIPGIVLLVTLGAMVCNLSLYNAYLASGSRGFFVLADDNLCPKALAKLNKKHKTPFIAILIMAIINIVLVYFDFTTLLVIDVFLFIAAYLVWFLAGIALRYKEPDLNRPFKIPGGNKFLIAIFIVPIIICIASFFLNGVGYMIGGTIGIITGPITYIIFKKMYGGLNNNKKLLSFDKKSTAILTAVAIVILVVGLFLNIQRSEEANAAFTELHQDYYSQSFDLGEQSPDFEADTFYSSLTLKDDPDLSIEIWYYPQFMFYATEFGGYSYIEGEFTEEEFADKVFMMVRPLTDTPDGLPLDYVEFEDDAGNYFYIEYGESYESAEAILAVIQEAA